MVLFYTVLIKLLESNSEKLLLLRLLRAIVILRHQQVGIGIGTAKIFFLSKNKTFMSNTPQYSFLYLIIRHQSPFSTIINFTTILYPNSTKLSNKTSMMKSSSKTQAGEI